MTRETKPCPFHGTLCEYVPMAEKVDAHASEIERLKAEVERMRKALEDIAYPNPVHGEDQLMQIARAALQHPVQEESA